MSKDQYSNNPDPFPGLEKDFYLMRCNKYEINMSNSTFDEFITKTIFPRAHPEPEVWNFPKIQGSENNIIL